jgi:hypothetical protein
MTDIHLQVRAGREIQLEEKLKKILKLDRHTFPGSVARYVIKCDEAFTSVQILLFWKSTEMPDDTTRKQDLMLFQEELADELDWATVQSSTHEVLIHT